MRLQTLFMLSKLSLVGVVLLFAPARFDSACAFSVITIRDGDGVVYEVEWDQSSLPVRWEVWRPFAPECVRNCEYRSLIAAYDTWSDTERSYWSAEFIGEYEGRADEDYGLNDGHNLQLWSTLSQDNVVGAAIHSFELRDGKAYIVDSDVVYNRTYSWSCMGDPDSMDVQNIATHEIGHVLGLDHSDDPDATMAGNVYHGETKKRTLTQDDIGGLCYLYPTSEWRPTATPTATAPKPSASVTETPENTATRTPTCTPTYATAEPTNTPTCFRTNTPTPKPALAISANSDRFAPPTTMFLRFSLTNPGIAVFVDLYIALEISGRLFFLSDRPFYPSLSPDINAFFLHPLPAGFAFPETDIASFDIPAGAYNFSGRWLAALTRYQTMEVIAFDDFSFVIR